MLVMNKLRILSLTFLTVASVAVITSCGDNKSPGWEFARNMYDPIAYNADQPNANFSNKQTAQLPPEGTIPVGYDKMEEYPNTLEGYTAAGVSMKNPLQASSASLKEGQLLYLHMCAHCHGATGNADGKVVSVGGFPPPPSYSTGNSSRGGAMKDLSDGKIFHTITYGVNLMGPHRTQLSPTERWKIVMYVHELQKAQ
ncbi:MAG: cytochrome c [Pyrinomonadaceae bacterium]|nr:cytochrome c [Sphingobacteriaceae bacterium]